MLEERKLNVVHYESREKQQTIEILWKVPRTQRPGEAFRLESPDDLVAEAMQRNGFVANELASFYGENEGMLSLRIFSSETNRKPTCYLALLRVGGQQHVYYFTSPMALLEFSEHALRGLQNLQPFTTPEEWPPWAVPSQL